MLNSFDTLAPETTRLSMRLRGVSFNRQEDAWQFMQLVFRPYLTRGALHGNIHWRRDEFLLYSFGAQAMVTFELADQACTP